MCGELQGLQGKNQKIIAKYYRITIGERITIWIRARETNIERDYLGRERICEKAWGWMGQSLC